MAKSPPQSALYAVLAKTQYDGLPSNADTVEGYDFKNGVDHHALLETFSRCGFQATNFGRAVNEINNMIDEKLKPIPEEKMKQAEENSSPGDRKKSNCTIFLGYTSNLISSGVREQIRYLVENNMVDCIVTTAGGIEEDFMKCFAPFYLGAFSLKGSDLYKKAINRTGNLLVPNDNYTQFYRWITPILDSMLKEQNEQGTRWTPSKMIARLGKEIDNPKSVYYWAYKNNIPVFCPAITDGAIGDNIYLHSYTNPGLSLDIAEDIRKMNDTAVYAVNTGILVFGGGVIKHHICNANSMRAGADYAVYVNTALEFDGSDAGANPDEAVSWGKIKATARPTKVFGEATIMLPLLVAETFARREKEFTAYRNQK